MKQAPTFYLYDREILCTYFRGLCLEEAVLAAKEYIEKYINDGDTAVDRWTLHSAGDMAARVVLK